MKITYLLLLGIGMIGCSSPIEPSLPEATQLGENTFGCFIDSQLWLPKKASSIVGAPLPVLAIYSPVTGILKIIAFQFGKGGSFIFKAQVFQNGKATLLIDQNNPEEETNYSDDAKGELYFPMAATSSLTITKLDTLNRIVSGNFSLTLVDKTMAKQISVTQGVFDIQFEVQ